jgi:hypothetical protein
MASKFPFLAVLLLLLPVVSLRGRTCEVSSPYEIEVSDVSALHNALRQVREWRRTGDERCRGGVTVVVKAGRYYLAEPLFFRPEDSGTADAPTIIRGEEGTVFCGDIRQRHLQLWPREGMERMVAFDTESRTITIATPTGWTDGTYDIEMEWTAQQSRGRNSARRAMMPWGMDATGMEMVVHQRWAIAILRVRKMEVKGETTVFTFVDPESRLEFDHPWPQPVIGGEKGNSSYLLRTTEHRDGVEQLVVVGGVGEHRVSHLRFEGITFENTCWNRPLHRGHVTLQGGMPLIDAYKLKEHEGLPWDKTLENQAWIERPVAAVSVSHCDNVAFVRCKFLRTGATALDFIDGTDSCSVVGCTFEDIGGTAVMAGSFAESPREVHRPYTDLAQRCSHLTIKGNTIHRVGTEDWGAVAIGCGYVCNTDICDNDVSGVPYSGICVGWGWTAAYTGMENNHIYNNKVSDYAQQLYDAGGIYTLSNQPGSTIRDNVVSAPVKAPYATNDRAFCIYLDARTDGFTISGNITDGRPVRRDEIGDNQPGPNIKIEN